MLGASGYGGGESLRWLAAHPAIEGIQGISRSLAGRPFATAHPNLAGLVEGTFVAEPDWGFLADAEHAVVISAMPHGELVCRLGGLEDEWRRRNIADRLLLLDLSADFRLRDPEAYARAYGAPHPAPALLAQFVYGLPERHRAELRGARRIACPGCFATAMQLALLPLLELAVTDVALFGVTGSSGSGMSPSDTTHHPTRASDFRAYRPLAHRHQAEAEQLLDGRNVRLAFVPHSAPIVRGIFMTATFDDPGGVPEAFARTYADAPFVRMVEGSPRIASVVGSNFADVGTSTHDGRAVVFVALDNLGKGMAGQAVHNMNLALGLDERTGLWQPGPFPV